MDQPSRKHIEPMLQREQRFAAFLDPLIEREAEALGIGDRRELTKDEHERLAEAVAVAALETIDSELLEAAAREGLLSMVLGVDAEGMSN